MESFLREVGYVSKMQMQNPLCLKFLFPFVYAIFKILLCFSDWTIERIANQFRMPRDVERFALFAFPRQDTSGCEGKFCFISLQLLDHWRHGPD